MLSSFINKQSILESQDTNESMVRIFCSTFTRDKIQESRYKVLFVGAVLVIMSYERKGWVMV